MTYKEIPADTLYTDDGRPNHDNPNHAGIRSHYNRFASTYEPDERVPESIAKRLLANHYKLTPKSHLRDS